ncbi:MAG TPA: hypothetical protein DEB31_08825 [Clostridiales bacterium]|nr:hypothetical protein [Clostridiales bacterium]
MRCTVKYCGGCQSAYDRAAFLGQLKEMCPTVEFVYEETGEGALLFICGCGVHCAVKGWNPASEAIIADSAEDLEKIAEKLMEPDCAE